MGLTVSDLVRITLTKVAKEKALPFDMHVPNKLMQLLLEDKLPLPQEYQDHPLQENYKGYRDAHIEPDWLLNLQTDR